MNFWIMGLKQRLNVTSDGANDDHITINVIRHGSMVIA